MPSSKKSIPIKEIPEGIISCLRNSDRHHKDAEILNEKKRYQSAITSIMLSCEELVKAKLLMNHFKDKKPVSEIEIKKYFREHAFRLEEFEKYFHDTILDYPEWAKNVNGVGKRQQDFKEKMTYTDWLGYNWHDPSYYHDLPALSDESEIETRLKNIYFVTRENFVRVWNALIKDPLMNDIKRFPKFDKPTKLKIIKIASDYLDPHTILVCVRVIDSKIQINVDPNLGDPNKIKQELKAKLRKRFPDATIEIRITSEHFASNRY